MADTTSFTIGAQARCPDGVCGAVTKVVVDQAGHLEAVVQRLQEDGGGGTIWDGEAQATHRPRPILWMSLEREMTGTPRQDRNPYLQLDANVMYRRIDAWEGDIWEKLGTSRAPSPWKLSEISSESITKRIVGILARGRQPQQVP